MVRLYVAKYDVNLSNKRVKQLAVTFVNSKLFSHTRNTRFTSSTITNNEQTTSHTTTIKEQ